MDIQNLSDMDQESKNQYLLTSGGCQGIPAKQT